MDSNNQRPSDLSIDDNRSTELAQQVREENRARRQRHRQSLTRNAYVQQRERNRQGEQLRIQNMTTEQVAHRLEQRRLAQQARRLAHRSQQSQPRSQSVSQEIRRNRARQRRADLTIEQRQQQLASRRSNYRQLCSQGTIFSSNATPRRARNTLRRPRESPANLWSMHIEDRTHQVQTEGINHVGRARQTSHLPTIPEEHSATTSLNEGRMRVPRGWERTQLTPLPRFTTDHSTYEHGSTSGSTNVHTNEECDQNSNREGQAEAAPLFEGQANHMDSDTRPYVNITRYNCARDFHEYQGIPRSQLPAPTTCHHCHARLFLHETMELCCKSGKTVLPPIPAPPEMTDLFCEQTADGRHFRKNIRAYNHVFSFISMGVHDDKELPGGLRGVYTFRAQGTIYHRIGSLLPYSDQRPRYLQLYIYDTDHEVEHRMSETSGLRRHIVEKLKHILDAYNPFVQNFRQLAQYPDIQDYKLIIKEQPVDRRQYDLPTASQVAAIIVGGDEAALIKGRDIVIQSIGGNLLNIQDITGFYDPMQYPLLLPHGTYGWDLNSRNDIGTKLTCRDFYAYRLQIRPNDQSLLLRGGRLLQQYVVDNYVKIESQKLRWMRSHQKEIRSDLYDGLQDSVHMGINNAGCCFVICPTRQEADKAVNACHNKRTLPGASSPLQVKYADGELERLGEITFDCFVLMLFAVGMVLMNRAEHKLFVGILPNNVSDAELSALFSQYGTITDLQILRGSQQTRKGCAFLKYETKEQALGAIEALNGKHTMENLRLARRNKKYFYAVILVFMQTLSSPK
ncbi:hypothetical protein Vadar_002482 [Vaccinium darrowii]|uniref:Uncharacterized protein n=1 Tax=Vaccinium darrowii TaxID=229202 RepID=A0ACB7YIX9_9ERIC|nr:hypothetical protein Vadar_002482 [Vaccinium darrowii]